MNTTKKILLGLGLASGVVLAALLASSDRGQQTKTYIARRMRALKNTPADKEEPKEESEVHYL